MSIIIKRKPKHSKKKLVKKIIILIFVYFISFITLYTVFGEHKDNFEEEAQEEQIVYKNDGEKFLAEGKYPEAIEFFQKKLSYEANNYVAMNRLGQAYYKLNQIDKAKFYFYKSSQLAPKYLDNYLQASRIYIEMGDYNAAENIVDIMPIEEKEDFVQKGKVLIQLADAEPAKEDKAVHYIMALSYFKKYNKKLYDENVDKLANLYFELADYYMANDDVDSAKTIYKTILRYKDDSNVYNKLAYKYQYISDIESVHYAKKAIDTSKTQAEKRLTRENLINLKYNYELAHNADKVNLLSGLLDIIDEEAILVDEQFTPFSISDDLLQFTQEKDDILPQVSFKITNKTDKTVNSLFVKIECYIHHNKIHESLTKHIVTNHNPLKSKEQTATYSVILSKPVDVSKINKYNVSLSLSTDGKNWYLYRLYKQEEPKKKKIRT